MTSSKLPDMEAEMTDNLEEITIVKPHCNLNTKTR
jgi:hypothetical protein